MGNEAQIIELLGSPKGKPIRFSAAEGITITKGDILVLSSNRAVAANSSILDKFAGIAAEDHTSGEGLTSISAWTCGVFGLTNSSSDTVTVGKPVITSGANLISGAAAVDLLNGTVIGKALETSSTSGAIINVAIGLY